MQSSPSSSQCSSCSSRDGHLRALVLDQRVVVVRATCVRLFEYRRQQAWPPTVVAGDRWDTLYAAAVDNIDALPDIATAVAWVNAFIERIDAGAG